MHEQVNAPPVIRFGPFTLDERSGELRNGPTRLKVPDQSIAVLQALLERPGELVTREALRERLWGPDTFVDFEAGLNAAVRRLREALNDSADVPRYIETLPRRGYRFIAPVDGASTAAPPAPAALVGAEAPAPARDDAARAGRVRLRHVVYAILALTIIGSAGWVGLSLRRNDAASAAARPVPITSFPGLELDPAISPAGDLVAYAWEGEGGDNFDIYVQSIVTGSRLPLTTAAVADRGPAWSPDGQQIAFVRLRSEMGEINVSGGGEIIVMPALGGPDRRLFEVSWPWTAGPWHRLSWTPDGKHLVFSDRSGSGPGSAVYLYSFGDGGRRQLTHPPTNLSDVSPVVSPDGRYLAFVRMNPLARGGNVILQKLEQLQVSGEPTPLTNGRSVLTFDWTGDSRSIIHDSVYVEPGLWRIAIAGGAPELVLPNIRAGRPSVARRGVGMVYQNSLIAGDIWELPTPSSPNRQHSGDATFRVIESTSRDFDMRFSPDGTRIAFVSLRSGKSELWVSNRDGSQQTQLTNFDGWRVGSPGWSADGKRIAFDATRTGTGNWNLYIVAADRGIVKPLTSDAFNNIRPSWSVDDGWIYFGSDRKGPGDWQIWKIPSTGGTPIQVTRGGGYEPIVAPDGRHIFYAKPPPTEGIWSIPAEGGQEVQIVPRGRNNNFDVAENGLFMMDPSAKPQATVEMFSFSSRQIVPVARLSPGVRVHGSSYLTVTRDGRSMLYSRFDLWMSDIEMLPGFR
jgi:Tol biopolymer transport system component/DNA-binding winged helix-turn-helix (wHTH) protein